MSRIAIITARGGSRRMPKKNIREFFGRPMISYSIEAALSSNAFDEGMDPAGSTEIAGVLKKLT